MSTTQQPIRTMYLLLALVVMVGAQFHSGRDVFAEPLQGFDLLSQIDRPHRQSAIASDLDPALDHVSAPATNLVSAPATNLVSAPATNLVLAPATAATTNPTLGVAEELLRLQQQLGGSVVTGRTELQGWKGPPAPVTARPTPASSSRPMSPTISPTISPLASQSLPQQQEPLPQPRGQSSPDGSAYPPSYRGGDFYASEFPGRDLASRAIPNLEVAELREAAWQLVTTAHRLEQLDLYDQADALRSLAQRLRQDARGMKQAERAAARASLDGRSTNE